MLTVHIRPSISILNAVGAPNAARVAFTNAVLHFTRKTVSFSRASRRFVSGAAVFLLHPKTGAFETGLIFDLLGVLYDTFSHTGQPQAVRLVVEEQNRRGEWRAVWEATGWTHADAVQRVWEGIRSRLPMLAHAQPSASLEGIVLRNYQHEAGSLWIKHPRGILACAPNAQPLTARILTPTGWKTMGEMRAGDIVVTPTGTARIASTSEHGVRPVYKVILNDGSHTECSAEHLWTTQHKGKWATKTTLSILESIEDKHILPEYEAWAGSTTPHYDLDPYVLGVILGDGSVTKSEIPIAKPDQELRDIISPLLPHGTWISNRSRGFAIRSHATCSNPVLEAIRKLGLHGRVCDTKFVPICYLNADPTSRLAVLQGLMDTDGYCSLDGRKNGFNTTSKQLADDVAYLARSLGGRARVRCSNNLTYRHPSGEMRPCRTRYDVTLHIGKLCPFRLPRKRNRWVPRKPVFRQIKSIEYVRDDVVRCIRLEDSTGLYLTDNFIVTHNSGKTEIAASIADRIGSARILITAPHQQSALIEQGAERFRKRGIRAVGVMRGGHSLPGEPIVWASLATIISQAKRNRARMLEWLNTFDIWIKDECHERSDAEHKLFSETRIWCRLGMSGTPFVQDALKDSNTVGVHGPVVYEITNADLVAAGVSAKPYVFALKVEHNKESTPSYNDYQQWADYVESLPHRNKLICYLAKMLSDQGYRVVVSCTHIERHAAPLTAMLSKLGTAELYSGGADIAERKRVLKRFESRATEYLVTSKVFNTGIDTAVVSAILLVGPSKKSSIQLQKLGRGLRTGPGKDHFVVVDMMDRIGSGKEQARQRLNVWRSDASVTLTECKTLDAFTTAFSRLRNQLNQ